MKRVGSFKSVFKSSKQTENNNDLNDKDEISILGNSVSQSHLQLPSQTQKDSSGSISIIPKGISNFFHKNVPLKGTLTRNKNKEKQSVN